MLEGPNYITSAAELENLRALQKKGLNVGLRKRPEVSKAIMLRRARESLWLGERISAYDFLTYSIRQNLGCPRSG